MSIFYFMNMLVCMCVYIVYAVAKLLIQSTCFSYFFQLSDSAFHGIEYLFKNCF